MGPLIAFALVVALPFAASMEYAVYIATLSLLYAIGAMSLHLIFKTGQVSLCHAAFMGIGGYTSSLLMIHLGWPWPFALLASVLLAMLVALALGLIVMRLTGVYFVLITFTLGEVAKLIFVEWSTLTGGSDGIYRIPPPFPFFANATAFYFLVAAFAGLTWLICSRILSSDIGRAMDALSESETLAEANGIPVFRVKVTIFVIACGLVAIQGGLEAHFIKYVSPLSYSFAESLRFVVMNVIGGLGSLAGPLMGAAFMIVLPEMLRGWVEYQWVMFGIALILVMRFLPGGLIESMSVSRRLLSRLTGRSP